MVAVKGRSARVDRPASSHDNQEALGDTWNRDALFRGALIGVVVMRLLRLLLADSIDDFIIIAAVTVCCAWLTGRKGLDLVASVRARFQPEDPFKIIDNSRFENKLRKASSRVTICKRKRSRRTHNQGNAKLPKITPLSILTLISTHRMSEQIREALFKAIHFKAYPKKVQLTKLATDIFTAIWKMLPFERNAKIRASILKQGLYMSDCFYAHSKIEDGADMIYRSMLTAIHREVVQSCEEILLVLKSLLHFEDDDSIEWTKTEEMKERFMSSFLTLIRSHATKNPLSDEVLGKLMNLVHYYYTGEEREDPNDYLVYRMIVEDEWAMPCMFDFMLHGTTWTKEHTSGVLGAFFTNSRDADVVTGLIRYFPRLAETFARMELYDLTRMLPSAAFSCIMLSSRSLLGRVASTILRPYAGRNSDMTLVEWKKSTEIEQGYQLARLLLEASVNDDAKRTELLGLGYLSIARFFANKPTGQNSDWGSPDPVFAEILRKHPEWARRFKQWTKDGNNANRTTSLGRNIVLRNSPGAATYIIRG